MALVKRVLTQNQRGPALHSGCETLEEDLVKEHERLTAEERRKKVKGEEQPNC